MTVSQAANQLISIIKRRREEGAELGGCLLLPTENKKGVGSIPGPVTSLCGFSRFLPLSRNVHLQKLLATETRSDLNVKNCD